MTIRKAFIVFLVTFALFSQFLLADTIILKNGRKIHTSWIKIDGDKVTYKWTGGMMTINKKLIEKIVKDDKAEPAKREYVESSSETPIEPPASDAGGATGNDKEDEKESAAYWNAEREKLQQEKVKAEQELKELMSLKSTIIAARRSTKDINKKIEEKRKQIGELFKEISELSSKARKYGVTEREIDLAEKTEEKEQEDGTDRAH